MNRPSAALLSTILLACAALVPSVAAAAVLLPPNFVNESIVSGLDQPTSFAFLPDQRVLVVEQVSGKVRMIVNGHVASTDPAVVVPQLSNDGGERGLLGLAVDPEWPTRPYVYLCYTRTGDRERLVRYTASGAVNNPFGESLTLASPMILLDAIPDGLNFHNAGCLRFGPDGYLYASLGDDGNRCAAADSTTLKGALLRLDVSRLPDGAGGPVPYSLITPPTNPFAGSDSVARLVWAYGLRNPWRFQIDPVLGAIYLADPGEVDQEELDEVLPGDFLGWPYREGKTIEDPTGCSEPGGLGANLYKAPIVAVAHGTGVTAITSAGMYRGAPGGQYNWPAEYNGFYGDVFYGDYYRGYLRRLKKVGGVWTAAAPVPGQPTSTNWATGMPNQADFLVGPDGSLWWLSQFDATYGSSTGRLQRIRYVAPSLVGVPAGASPSPALRADHTPFASRVELAFHLARSGPTRLTVVDVSGRLVRRLHDGELSAGENRLAWDGRDDNGDGVANGVYFARLTSTTQQEIATLVRIR